MKKTILFAFTLATTLLSAQTQIGNSDLESWENVASDQEPTNWNSFLTASGTWNGFAANQIESSTDVRPGSSGTLSARIWSRSPFSNLVANGNMTLGQINMGSTTPNDPANYNISVISNPEFSEACTDYPDSLVFWAKFNPVTSSSMARVKATIHDNNSYRDPEDASSQNYVVGTAELNYGTTNDAWQRISVPFDYSGPATTASFILVTFTTNMTPGGGDANDEVYIDDIELIYNTSGIEEETSSVNAWLNNETNTLNFEGNVLDGTYSVHNANGALVQEGSVKAQVDFNQNSGVYFVTVKNEDQVSQFQVFKN